MNGILTPTLQSGWGRLSPEAERNTPVQKRNAGPAPTEEGRDRPRTGGWSSGECTLPIELDPADSGVFLDTLLRTREGWIEVSYQDGRQEVHREEEFRSVELLIPCRQ